MATVAGEPLYAACGFTVIERMEVPTSRGVTVPCARMAKPLRSGARRSPVQAPTPRVAARR